MQTDFAPHRLSDPGLREAEKILRACVHCGFCNATCPTFLLTGDELDSPRGRIYMMKEMLESGRPASPKVLTHIDRCLSCLSCMTTCPSGVHYMHLVDEARTHIAETGSRPWPERLFRRVLGAVLSRPLAFRLALAAGRLVRPISALLPKRAKTMLARMPADVPTPSPIYRPQVFPAEGERRKRVALLAGCAQQVLKPAIDEATIRFLTRHGCEVVVAEGAGCCGALKHHLGDDAQDMITANVSAWTRAFEMGGLDAIIINASGCGTMVKDYGYLMREEPDFAANADRVAHLAKDVCEFAATLELKFQTVPRLRVAYQGACSLQHGQRIHAGPKALLAAAGFTVVDVAEGHICCGSAGTYNLLQPEMADALRNRKAAHVQAATADVLAVGNIGCIMQLRDAVTTPVVHPIQLMDWATGGPKPAELSAIEGP